MLVCPKKRQCKDNIFCRYVTSRTVHIVQVIDQRKWAQSSTNLLRQWHPFPWCYKPSQNGRSTYQMIIILLANLNIETTYLRRDANKLPHCQKQKMSRYCVWLCMPQNSGEHKLSCTNMAIVPMRYVCTHLLDNFTIWCVYTSHIYPLPWIDR